tara:strand:- start:220 stop:1167 length:948 start_codon:yes stop_codon:yes gene_type:complete
MSRRKWLKFTFLIDKTFEDLIIWKLSELRIVSYAFSLLENRPNSLKVEIWLLESKCNDQFKLRLEEIFESLLEDNNYNPQNFYWDTIDEDWLDSWKNFWGPEEIGSNFLVLPSWMDLPNKFDSKKVIKIDPGAAFGTGSHPSTYLCLQEIEKIQIRSRKILDIGCGSGILTIAAKLLGGNKLYAVDNDYLAINSAKENIELNFGNSLDINLYESSFQEFVGKKEIKDFDLVMCNILADVIKKSIPSISEILNLNGKVILSGILSSQQREIIKILNLNDFSLDNVSSREDWVCIKATKKINNFQKPLLWHNTNSSI